MSDCGAAMGLVARGPQDRYLFDPEHVDTWDVRRKFLREPYATVYRKLSTAAERRVLGKDGGTSVSFTLLCGGCDMVNDLDLVLACCGPPGIPDLGGILRRVEVRIGDQRIDGWEGSDLGTLIGAMCAVFGRRVSRHGDRLFVPLALAPFHSHNLLSMVGLKRHAVVIAVEFGDDAAAADADAATSAAPEIWGKTYFLSKARREAALSYQMGIAETQWGGDHVRGAYLSHTAHHLRFDHPISMLLFWGVDKTTVREVALQLNGHDFYRGPLAPLERIKEERGLGHVEPVIFFFSQEPPSSAYQSTVNFSRIDSAVLYILTSDDGPWPAGRHDRVVHVHALSVHPMWVADGGAGKYFETSRRGSQMQSS
jgi:hypothetical protein